MVNTRGVTIWIPAFLSFLSILGAIAMVLRWVELGRDTLITPYLIGVLGTFSIEIYLWIFVVLTAIFLGITFILVYRKQPPDPELVKMLLKIGGNLAALRKSQEASMAEITNQMEYDRKVNRKFITEVTAELKEDNKKSLALLEGQEKALKKTRTDLVSAINKSATETGDKMAASMTKQEATITILKRLNEESAEILKTQQAELEELKARLERIEGNMVPMQAKLKSADSPEEIKGIGPALGKELRSMGINSVGDFLTTDAAVIGEKTRVSQEMAENLQAAAQLTMVSGIDEDDAELLVDAGIKSRKQLADQDLIQLSRKVSELAKIYVAQGKITSEQFPSIEKISAWIRNAK